MLEKIKNRVLTFSTAFVISGVMVFGGATSAMAAPGDVVNPLVSKTYNYTSEYGGRCVPTLWASANHLGQDFSAKDGTKIRSIAKGTVSFIQQPSGSSVSGKVVVKHVIDGKTYHSAYLHMWNPTKYVKVGQSVSKGQVIAEVGSSGPSTGPHLHFEMYQGNYKTGTSINPTTFLKNQGVDIKTQATSVTTRKQPSSCTYYSNANTTLKSSANSTSSNLVSVSKGDKMSSVNAVSTQSGNYLRVTVNGKTGWLYRGYISPSYVAPDFKNGDRLKVTGQSNFRSGPTSSHSVIKKVYANEIVISTGKYQTNYYEVKSGDRIGWVHKNYLTKAPAEAVAKPKPAAPKPAAPKPAAPKPAAPKPAAPKPAAKTVSSAQYTNNSVNFRTGAGTSYKVIQYLAKNTNVTATGVKSGNWVQVKYGSKTGWVSGNYLTKGKAPAKTSTSGASKGTTVKTTPYHTKADVNFRTGASTKHKVIAKVKKNTNVSYTGKKSGAWLQVKIGNKTGWISGNYLTNGAR